MSLKLAANICGALALVIGLLVKTAPRGVDQIGGNALIVLAIAGLLTANLGSGKPALVAQWALCVPAILSLAYFVFRRAL
ncbi:MAG: hypothetical protein KAF27_11750 [Porphyrobacter sp.]|nr:hypothetical protein [Porphyrobacter sp.]